MSVVCNNLDKGLSVGAGTSSDDKRIVA
jgi:hypothetical protein